MSIKQAVSAANLSALLEQHGHKKFPKLPSVLMTGTERAGSIGEAIARRFDFASSYIGDVTQDIDRRQLRGHDTLIMCHGEVHLDWFEDAPLDRVKAIFDVNLFGSYNMAQAFVQESIGLDVRKRIVMIGSMAHRAVLNGSSAYCASKAGLAHLARCMAWELAPKGYDVYCVHPSNTLGAPMSEATIIGLMRYRGLGREEAEAYWNDSPIRTNTLTPEDIAEVVKSLIDNKSGYMSGSQVELAGGLR